MLCKYKHSNNENEIIFIGQFAPNLCFDNSGFKSRKLVSHSFLASFFFNCVAISFLISPRLVTEGFVSACTIPIWNFFGIFGGILFEGMSKKTTQLTKMQYRPKIWSHPKKLVNFFFHWFCKNRNWIYCLFQYWFVYLS